MLTPYSPKLVCTGRQWWPVWAAVRGGVGVACRTGGRQYWPTPWPSAVLAVGPCGWCTGWRSLPPSAVVASVGRCPSVAVVALAGPCGGLVGRRWCPCTLRPFRGPCGPCFGPCQWWASRWPCGVRAGVPVAAAGVPVSARVGRAGRGVLALRVVSFPVFSMNAPPVAGRCCWSVLAGRVTGWLVGVLVGGPCWCRASGGRGRPSIKGPNTSGRRGGLAGGVGGGYSAAVVSLL